MQVASATSYGLSHVPFSYVHRYRSSTLHRESDSIVGFETGQIDGQTIEGS